jgi:hypothetical protein
MKNEIILYQADELPTHIEVKVDEQNETIWLTQEQIAELYGTQRPAISKHLKNIFKLGELEEKVVSSILEHTTQHVALKEKRKQSKQSFTTLMRYYQSVIE